MEAPPDGDAGGRLLTIDHHLPESVPALASRWSPGSGMNFSDFTQKTLAAYY